MAYEIDWEKGVVDAPAQPAAAEPDLSFLEQYEAQQPPAVPGAPSAAARPSIGAGYETTDWNVTPEQLVEKRIANMVDEGSPLMQQARTKSLQEMNRRGLVNSSMAVGAGQEAVLSTALPIATADASTTSQAAQQNAAAKTGLTSQKLGIEGQLAGVELGAEQQLISQGYSGDISATLADQAARNAIESQKLGVAGSMNMAEFNANNALIAQNLDNLFKANLSTADLQTRTQIELTGNLTRETLANIEANYQSLLGANASAQQMYGMGMQNITDIMSNPNMDAASKNEAITTQLRMLETGIGVLDKLNALNLSDVLDFSVINP